MLVVRILPFDCLREQDPHCAIVQKTAKFKHTCRLSDEMKGDRVKVSHCGAFFLFFFQLFASSVSQNEFLTQAPLLLVPPHCLCTVHSSFALHFFFLCPPTLRNCLTCLCRSTLSVIVTRSHRTSALTYSCCVWLRGSQTWVTFVFPRRLYKHTQEEETYPPAGFFFQLRTARARRRAVRSAVWLLLVRGSALGHLVSVVVALS